MTSHQAIEYHLILAGLVFPFFYFVLRALIWDTFLWIAIVPPICALYILFNWQRYLPHKLNALDTIFLLYLLYGFILTGFGVTFLGYSLKLGVEILIHFYSPVVLYFVARNYTRNSPSNVFLLTKLIWILAVVLAVDVFIEYYIVEVNFNPLAVPWVALEINKIPAMTPEIWNALKFGQTISFLTSRKHTGVLAIALFAFIVPFLNSKRNPNKSVSWQFWPLVNYPILVSLVLVAYIARNRNALLAGFVFLVITLISLRSSKLLLLVGGLAVLTFLHYDELSYLVRTTFLMHHYPPGYGFSSTTFGYIVDPQSLIDGYKALPLHRYIFGSLALPSEGEAGVFSTTFGSELRIFLYPTIFGMGWVILLLAAWTTLVKYCYTLIKSNSFKVFGFAFLGFLFIYTSDVHYPTFMRHGTLELFLVLAAGLSSLRDIEREPSYDSRTG